jgi:hypothetical protein
LKAVCLWKTGSNSGGGLFRSTNTYWVNNPASLVRDSGEVQRDESEPDDVYRRIWRGMYFRRLIRDGWNLSGSEIDRYRVPVRRFEKKINDHWILRRIAHEGDMQRAGQAYAHDEYVLVEPYAEEIQNRLNWDWADIMLYDFNDMTFQKIEAPY